ncbi:cytochrome b [Noviherbaspirillum denitrificans]|uniref:cytochrome b n=1 Tax=Noviherbaspirillum denitrificans TaxID=1968433 RepID=UPI000B5387D0|nr:cytochrome b [Noviherbaspirillum denitrificans]
MGRGHSIGLEALEQRVATVRAGRYSLPAVALHWVMAVLLIGQVVLGLYMVELPKRTPEVAYYYGLHKSFGLIALMLITLRVWWRLRNKPPAPVHMPAAQERAAAAVHRLLYVCMAVIPLSGFAGSNFGKHPVKFFGYALPLLGWESTAAQAFFRYVHVAFVWLLCALVAVHLLAVVYHLLKSGAGLLRRMLP